MLNLKTDEIPEGNRINIIMKSGSFTDEFRGDLEYAYDHRRMIWVENFGMSYRAVVEWIQPYCDGELGVGCRFVRAIP
ncbi:MAG: hypothetical protein K2Z81_05255 [Cyanobacteria bacterium]|nr:hypothetical protein [Cyanobacteriota bacterium]